MAAYLYEGDAPLAERKAQALALDRKLLRELLGQEELRELLDPEVIAELFDELQGLAEGHGVRHEDDLHDLLRRVGDLTRQEVAERIEGEGDAQPWIEALLRQRRALEIRLGGEPRLIAVEDAGLYRDALGALPPPGVPKVFLEPVAEPFAVLVRRFAKTRVPFVTAEIVERYGIRAERVEQALRDLEVRNQLLHGEFRPGGREREWCDPEILRRIKRRTLARLRGEIAPVEPKALGRFLPSWHGVGEARIGQGRLEEAIAQLEGLPLSYSELENVILPGRIRGFRPQMLDELGALGWLVWVGAGAAWGS